MRRDRPGRGRQDRTERGDPGRRSSAARHTDRKSGQGDAPSFRKPGADMVALYGVHAVREALRVKGRKLLALYATVAAAERIAPDAALAGLTPQIVEGADLDRRLGAGAVHQGLMLEARPLPARDLSDIENNSGIVLVLDQITDPHNVGAILRTACAFGADAVVTTTRYAPRETGTLAKSASGALDLVPLITVRNLGDTLEALKTRGLTCIGFDSEAETPLLPGATKGPLAIVLGAEGKGLRQRTRELCDQMVRLDMPGPIKSLNVSNAAAIALFAATATK